MNRYKCSRNVIECIKDLFSYHKNSIFMIIAVIIAVIIIFFAITNYKFFEHCKSVSTNNNYSTIEFSTSGNNTVANKNIQENYDSSATLCAEANNTETVDIHNLAIILLTLFMLLILYIQLSTLGNVSKSDFLFKIKEGYSSPENIKAREIIDKFHINTLNELKNDPKYEELKDKDDPLFWLKTNKGEYEYQQFKEKLYKMIGEKIVGMSMNRNNTTDPGESFEYTLLINLINYFDTISTLITLRREYKHDVIELMGESINYYYKVYKPWIERRRCLYGKLNYYNTLEDIVNQIQNNYRI